MKKEEIIGKVKALNLPKGSYIVFGSCPLAVAGIREANDIDLLVSEELFAKLKETGWQELRKSPNDIPLVHDVFEAHKSWNFGSYNPTLAHLLSTATLVDEIPFASLKEVRRWKLASGRPKDLADIELIDKYIQNKNINHILEKIMTAEEYSRLKHKTPYLYTLRSGDKELFYFGARHSRNPKDAMFAEIEKEFNAIRPDMVFVEGISGLSQKRARYEEEIKNMSREKIIDFAGESGFTLALATQNSVACESPEPKDSDLYNFLLDAGFSKEHIFAYEVFQILPQYHRRANRAGFKNDVTPFIERFEQETRWENFDYSYEHALKIGAEILGKGIDVENVEQPTDYIDPIPWKSKKGAQTVLNEISRGASLYRDQYMVKEIAAALEHHKKLFIVFGASHAVMQEPALRELMKG